MAEFPSQKLMHTRSCSATSTRGIYCLPCQDCQINLAVPLVLLVLQKHLELLAHWVGEAFDGNTLMGLYQTCSWVVMDWSAINSQINAFFFFWQHNNILQDLSRAKHLGHCTLSGSRADGPDGAAPDMGIWIDGYFPAWGSQLEDLLQR